MSRSVQEISFEAERASRDAYRKLNPTVIVVFGATGDLARTKLLPALFHLYKKNLLPKAFQIIGFSRRPWTNATFKHYLRGVIRDSRLPGSAKVVSQFCRFSLYQQGLFEERMGYDALGRRLGMKDKEWLACSNKLFYLAVPPESYEAILDNLKASGLTKPCSPEEGWTRVVVEKPFGKDLKTAEALDSYLGKLFKEEQIYRIDHYLGKETVQNISAFRFSNSFFEPSLNRDGVESIHLKFSEVEGVEDRVSFFEGVGALRDVGQNHLCQFLAHFTMDNPGVFSAQAVRRRRFEVLSRLALDDSVPLSQAAVRGQYEGYRREKGVASSSTTETYFRVRAQLNTPRWSGVPIYFEGGKALDVSLVEIVVTFRHPTPCLCPPGAPHEYQNVLRYQIKPTEGIYASLWVKKPGGKLELEEREFSFRYRESDPALESVSAYERLLLDAVAGNQTLFVSTDEIMASWRFIDPILAAWQKNKTPLVMYPKGTHPLSVEGEARPRGAIGVVGLGKMGKNMTLRLREKGWEVAAWDVDPRARRGAPPGVLRTETVRDLAERQKAARRRLVWLMIPAGKPVDEILFKGPDALSKILSKGDIIIDGGNSFYRDTVRRAARLRERGISYIDVGFSGGPAGARRGGSLMVGGDKEVAEGLHDLFLDLAVPGGCAYLGKSGAGHFAKMVHNGIEYGMMQALAEGFAVLRKSSFPFDLEKVARVYANGSVVESRLAKWLQAALASFGPDLKGVSGTVAHTGEGEWTVKAAKALKVPVPVIRDAFLFRVASAKHPSYAGKVLSALRHEFGGHSIESKIRNKKSK